ncbi:endoribonuclease Dicer-like [Contarinia nasturtii]|uniref:endoribonuclease Dicer-like n=1 Tax=Contarinia nasturtii TaxID=265458 RepID=UPI0012D449EE|nr:endoribonuclease Dicer-like [Contarinia nasturtii]
MSSDQDSFNETEFKSRGYQDEILKSCIQRNTIIYLPTGAGKTYIAIMALKHFAKDLEKPISQGGKRSVFLTNTVALAHQQAEVIAKSTPLNVGVYTGDMNVDAWGREKWFTEFEENHVITATVQIVLDIIRHGYLKISNFNLIVFDECHNAQGEHPMLMLMEKFCEVPEKDHPRVIGLTGMLTTSSIKPMNVLDDLRKLEGKFRATITTAKGAAFNDVLMYSTRPVEQVIIYEKYFPSSFQEFIINKVDLMHKLIKNWPLDVQHETNRDIRRKDKQPKVQSKYEGICRDFTYQMTNLGLYGATLSNLAAIVDMELKKREADTSSAKWVSRALITAFEEILHIQMRNLYDDEEDDSEKMQTEEKIDEQKISDDPATILLNSSPQVQKLLSCLKTFVEENEEPMKGLIFVDRRYSARILCHVIRRYANAFPNLDISVEFMTGRNAFMPDSVETLMNNKNNNRVLDRFRRGEINLIVATSVLEEGIDLQECNLVIAYDAPKTFRSYVQRKGRARMPKSKFVMMTPSAEHNKLQMKAAEWQEVNRILKDYLVLKAIDRPPPMQDDIDRAIELKYNEKFTTPKGATVDYNSTAGLINRYCGSLPHDMFTVPAVQWEETIDKNGKYIGSLMLPIQSPIKEKIISKPMPTSKLAKRSAAFEAIKQLYYFGELTDNLMPINRNKCLDKYKDVYFRTWNDFKHESKDAGTRKNYRMHDIQTPRELKASMPRTNVQLYLYEITMDPNFKVSDLHFDVHDENIKIFHSLLQSPRSYGILTTKPLPRMGTMTFFQSFGEIKCCVSANPKVIKLGDPQKLNELKRFHCVLFKYILDIWKTFFVYDQEDSVIIVPTINQQINWQIVEQFQTWSELKGKTIAERTNAMYRRDEWEHFVICPWYRADQNTRYVVTQVSEHQTPLSEFPNNMFPNYASYVLNKYPNIDRVVNDNQFLIGVKGITTHFKQLTPGEGDDGSRKNTKQKPRGPEFLIPELCHNFRYPGDLWLKAVLLPSVLHRITYILHAEYIRNAINNYVGLNIVNYVPDPLIEKMAKNKDPSNERAPIQNSIVFPKADEITPKELTSGDIARFDSDTAILGPEIREPIDLERHFDNVYEVDIDYYYQFIHRAFSGLSLDESKNANKNSMLSPHRFHTNVPALCDVVEEDRLRINILDTKITTEIKRGVEQHEILAAITTASSADVFHMELLEVLGDAFLKFSVSLYLIQSHPDWHEGFLTTIKGQIVGNRHLCYSGIRKNIPGMLKVHHFNPKADWQPPMLKVDDQIQISMQEYHITPEILYKLILSNEELERGEVSQSNFAEFIQQFLDDRNAGGDESTMQNFLGKQRLADKTIADCIEAILGACVKSIGVERTFKVLEWFEILPSDNKEDITKMLQHKLRSPRTRTNISDHEVDYFLANHKKLEDSLGYTFKDRAYLLQALTHPSYPTNRVTGCYQQLEFLGDAVLDFLVTAYIFERCPHMDPGKLTDLRSALVNNVTLACLCVRYNIHVHILSQSPVLTESINRFVDFQQKHNFEVADHVELLMEERDYDCKMADYVDVPKTLGDVMEAIIGGIFLDSGNNLDATWNVIYRLMSFELHKFMANVPIQMVRQLYEYPNANPDFEPPVVDEETGIVLVNLQFTCNGEILLVHGFGTNKDNAKRAAAKLALSKLRRS